MVMVMVMDEARAEKNAESSVCLCARCRLSFLISFSINSEKVSKNIEKIHKIVDFLCKFH